MDPMPPDAIGQPHVIRLLGPWDCKPLARTACQEDGEITIVEGELPPPSRVKLPADWQTTFGPHFFGRVRLERRFGRPTGLDAHSRVDLVCFTTLSTQFQLNQQFLGAVNPRLIECRYRIDRQLRPRNLLTVDVHYPMPCDDLPLGNPVGLVGEVRLEISRV